MGQAPPPSAFPARGLPLLLLPRPRGAATSIRRRFFARLLRAPPRSTDRALPPGRAILDLRDPAMASRLTSPPPPRGLEASGRGRPTGRIRRRLLAILRSSVAALAGPFLLYKPFPASLSEGWRLWPWPPRLLPLLCLRWSAMAPSSRASSGASRMAPWPVSGTPSPPSGTAGGRGFTWGGPSSRCACGRRAPPPTISA